MFEVTSESMEYHLADLPAVIILGVIGGILGSLYNFLLDKLLRIYVLINEYVHYGMMHISIYFIFVIRIALSSL